MTMPSASRHVAAVSTSYPADWHEPERLVGKWQSADLPQQEQLAQYPRGAELFGSELLGANRKPLEAVEQPVRRLDQGALKPRSVR